MQYAIHTEVTHLAGVPSFWNATVEDRIKAYDARVNLYWLTCMKLAQTPKY